MDFRDKQEEFISCEFEGVEISGEIVERKIYEACVFSKCNLINFGFIDCKFIDCQFLDCVLSAVNFTNSSISDIKIKNSKMVGIDWTKTKQFEGFEAKDSSLDMSNFRFLKLEKAKIIDCSVRECDFTETNLTAANLENNDFEKSRFFKTNLSDASLRKAKNYDIDVKNTILKKTKLSMPEAMRLLDGLDIVLE
jgi:uncharacterized protein YjbI with pentapeptide repeats